MQRFAALLAFALVLAAPLAANAKHATPAPGAMPVGTLAPAPMSCGASDPTVWVNTSSKIYWPVGSKYYGKTKHGGYACTAAAIAMGARAAKASPIGHKSAMGAATAEPAAPATPAGKKKHHRGATPAPSPNP